MNRQDPGLLLGRQLGRRAFLGSAFLGSLVAGGLVLGARPLVAAVPGAGRIDFDIRREGSSIGRHSLRFRKDGPLLRVDVEIEIDIYLAFIRVFSYRHRNSEVWKAGRLVSLETETDDDGESYRVSALAMPEGLRVEGSGGAYLAPAGTIPTSYWDARTLKQSSLLDTQRGGLLGVQVDPLGEDRLETGQAARRYRLSGDLDLELWYSPAGEWLKIAFETRGAEISYARLPVGAESEAAG